MIYFAIEKNISSTQGSFTPTGFWRRASYSETFNEVSQSLHSFHQQLVLSDLFKSKQKMNTNTPIPTGLWKLPKKIF